MKQTTLITLCLQLSIFTVFGQNLTDTWYETQNPDASLEIMIDKNNEAYSGTFNWKWKTGISTVNTPLDNVIVKKDSLLLELTHANLALNFKLKKEDNTDNFKGFFISDHAN